MRVFVCFSLLVAALLLSQPVLADDALTLTIKGHHFIPDHLTVPAGVKFKLHVVNADLTAEEFESDDLNREKVVGPGHTIKVFLGPLAAGTYHFFGDYHQDTAQGILIAK